MKSIDDVMTMVQCAKRRENGNILVERRDGGGDEIKSVSTVSRSARHKCH